MREFNPLYFTSANDLMDYVNSNWSRLIGRGRARFGLSVEDCEDCIGQACMEVYPKLNNPEKLIGSSYFVTCFLRDCCDCARRKNPSESGFLEDMDLLASNSLTPFDELLRTEETEKIDWLLRGLKERDRLIFQLRIEGYCSRNIAEMLNLSARNVHSRTYRVRQNLGAKSAS